MQISQIYETTVIETENDIEARFLVIPDRSIGDRSSFTPEGLIEVLGLTSIGRLRPPQTARMLAMALAIQDPEEFRNAVDDPDNTAWKQISASAYFDFTEYLMYARLIPFEQSPIDLESLAGLITSASGVGIGAYAGLVLGYGTPLVFITIPAGMLICGAAAGVAKALEEGLREKVLSFFKRRTKESEAEAEQFKNGM